MTTSACSIAAVAEHIVQKHIDHGTQADAAYGAGVAKAIAAPTSSVAAAEIPQT